ncbi:SH3 and multiple ankyrin repeat domains protein 1 isoform X3 [Drosophila simulans]|uniref:SH3 and multiple ankyrin repeat domains protein 1 isoform X3 n=1 Tax=Drosophila simulans TaxID=7240 RepID=UPI00192D19FB|nr:SH3 and multiple ankyrin repeat domains protein 1 isoform X3 [Drosophila simulans]
MSGPGAFDDEPPPEPRDGWLLVRIHVPELNVYKCLQFPSERLVWDVKQQVLASLPKVAFWFKELKESFNYGLFAPPANGKAGKFLDEERRLGDYPFNGPVGYLELKYKRRVYKMLTLDERQLKALHTRANLRRFLECINGGHVEKIAKMCAKGLDPNFHCSESGDTPLTVATGAKKPNKLLIALVNGGALLDYRTKDGTTALHRAVEHDSLEAVSTLLELGASPNYRDGRGITPLYISITRKCEAKITESLLHDHATLGIQDSQGWNEVHQVAVIAGNLELAEIIENYKSEDIVPFRGPPRYNPKRRSGIGWLSANGAAGAALLAAAGGGFGGAMVGSNGAANGNNGAGGVGLMLSHQNHQQHLAGHHQQQHMHHQHHQNHHQQLQQQQLPHLHTLQLHGPPSPCPSEHMLGAYSSASSSLSEGSSGHRSHEDDISIVTDKSLGDTSDIISDSSGVGTNSDSAACSIGHPSTTVVCMEPYAGNTVGHIRLQPGDVIEVVGSTDCGLLEGYVRGTNQSGFFPADCVQEVSLRQKHITNVMTASTGMAPQQQQQQHLQQAPAGSSAASYQGSPQLSLGGHSGSSSTLLQQPHQSPSLSVASNGSCQQPLESNGGGASGNGINNRNNNHSVGQYSSATAPRIKKSAYNAPRSVVLHRAKRGFGFILRGAKASSQLMQLRPSERFPALQYLDDVDPGGVADMAGLRPGDFLLTINGEDVSSASHEQVVEMIRSAGALVNLTVVSPQFPHQMQASAQYLPSGARAGSHHLNSGPSTPQSSHRQCATLPRKMTGPGGSGPASSSGGSVRMAPMPPRRDPKTTLSVGRARAKSMVAGLENGGEKEDDLPHTKSNSVESIATPTPTGIQTGPGTPVQLRTASIKARPTSSRITAAELEELFQRQQGEGSAANASRYATMMTSSRFQSGTDSGAATPPASNGSPMRSGPLVYGSVAEMKRKTARSKHGSGTLRGKPVATPTVGPGGAGGGRDLKRFHSTPDLHGPQLHGSASSIWQASGKGHHSQDDVATLHASLQRLNSNQGELKLGGLGAGSATGAGGAVLPPPNHPPPPPPVGQVVKVETRSSVSEYESTISLQQKLKKRAENDAVTSAAIDGVQSSFNPSANAKIYASPQELRNVMAWKLRQAQEKPSQETSAGSQQPVSQYAAPTQMRPAQQQQQQQQQAQQPPTTLASHYAAPQVQVQQVQQVQQSPQQSAPQSPPAPPLPQAAPVPAQNGNGSTSGAGSAPPIPEPDYSCSESDGEDENSILVARNTKLNEKIALFDVPETSGNSQASGSSSNSGSASISHSLSVEEIQRIRSNLKTSKSSPNGFAKKPEDEKPQEQQQSHQQPQQLLQPGEDECDNSSSGVSSEQEQLALAAGVTLPGGGKPTDTIKKKPSVTIVEEPKTIPDQPSSNTSHTTKPMAKTTISIGGGGSTVPTATLTVKQLVQQQHAPVIQQQQQQLGSKQPVTPASTNKFTQQSTINSNVMSPQVLGRIPSHHHQQQSSNPNQKLIATQQQILQQQQQQLAHQQHLQQILKAKAAAAGGASNTAVLVAKHQQKLHKGTSSGHESEMETRSDLEDDDGDLSPSPPAKAFQRHNSLTRKQAAAIAMQRGATRTTAVSLMQLPPPLEADSDGEPSQLTLQRQQSHHPSQTHPHPHQLQQQLQLQQQQQQQQQPMAAHIVGMLPSGQLVAVASGAVAGVPGVGATAVQQGNNNLQQLCTDNLVLAPPPQFCDCNDAKHAPQPHLPTSQYHPQQQQQQQHQQQQQQQQQLQQQLQQQQMLQMHQRLSGGAGAGAVGTLGRVRIVGAMPKANHHRLH